MQASLGLSMLLWWRAPGYPALALFALWMGLSYGGVVSLMPALCMDLYGARAVASTIGTLYTGAAIGNIAGPWVAGRVFDTQGSYAAVIAGCAVLSRSRRSRLGSSRAPLRAPALGVATVDVGHVLGQVAGRP